ncbi:MAG TPA: hypothetical protein VHO90_07420 [Bacteroidales bacterium]|nr:hypothetical protein [Bacteroidales bacterium]
MRPWLNAQNPFLNATEENYHDAHQISVFHENALNAAKGDPGILTLYNNYHPIHLDFLDKYNKWKTQGGLQEGDTDDLVDLLLTLRGEKIRDWDVRIQNIYNLNTSQYTRLLPDRRAPFQQGGQGDRIEAVKSLLAAMGTDEKLTTVKADVNTFFLKLDAAFGQQKTSKSTTTDLALAMEASRVSMCVGQFVDLGSLIIKYPTSPESIEKFFDLATIRRGAQTEFTGTLKPEQTKVIAKHSFNEGDQIILNNTGDSKLRFYLAQKKDLEAGTIFVEMNKGEQTVLASALGKIEDTYLKVFNSDALVSGSYTVKFL